MAQLHGTEAGSNLSSACRCRIAMGDSGDDAESQYINVRLTQVTVVNIRVAFSIPPNVDFYLSDKHNNVEFPDPASQYAMFDQVVVAILSRLEAMISAATCKMMCSFEVSKFTKVRLK